MVKKNLMKETYSYLKAIEVKHIQGVKVHIFEDYTLVKAVKKIGDIEVLKELDVDYKNGDLTPNVLGVILIDSRTMLHRVFKEEYGVEEWEYVQIPTIEELLR